jgi:hypothetical protein
MTKCWEPGTEYAYGSVVEYQGNYYKIIQPHRSQGDWAPDRTPALWGRVPDHECHQYKQHNQGSGGYGQPQQQQQQQQPAYQQQPPQQQQNYGYGQANQSGGYGSIPQPVPENSDDPRKQKKDGFDI